MPNPLRPAARFLGVPLSCLLLLGGCGRERPRWNVVLVSVDTLRADHLRAYGYERETSPELDRLAATGLVFENAYSQAPKTAPSHMSILTGLYPDAHGVRNFHKAEENHRLADSTPTLATILRGAGYRTAAFTSGGHVRPDLGFDQGFERYQTGGDLDRIFGGAADAAAEFAGEPFFLFVHTYEVHDPYLPPEEYGGRWAEASYEEGLADRRGPLDQSEGWRLHHDSFWDQVDPESVADLDQLRALYDGSILYTDEWLGRLIARLEELGEMERTLLVFLSDHGEEFQEHGGFLHDTLHREVLHVPLVFALPEGTRAHLRGRRVTSAVRLIDVLPTVLDFLGLDAPDHLQGRSLLRVARPRGAKPEPVLSHWPRNGIYSLRTERWKLIWWSIAYGRSKERAKLYDVVADPREQNDVAEANPEVVAKLRTEILKTIASSKNFLEQGERGSRIELDGGLSAELQALGYLGDDE